MTIKAQTDVYPSEIAREFDRLLINFSNNVENLLNKGRASGMTPIEALGEGRCTVMNALIRIADRDTFIRVVNLINTLDTGGFFDDPVVEPDTHAPEDRPESWAADGPLH